MKLTALALCALLCAAPQPGPAPGKTFVDLTRLQINRTNLVIATGDGKIGLGQLLPDGTAKVTLDPRYIPKAQILRNNPTPGAVVAGALDVRFPAKFDSMMFDLTIVMKQVFDDPATPVVLVGTGGPIAKAATMGEVRAALKGAPPAAPVPPSAAAPAPKGKGKTR